MFGFGDRVVVVVVVLFDVVDVVVVVVYFPKADLRSSSVSTNMKMPVMMAMEPRAFKDFVRFSFLEPEHKLLVIDGTTGKTHKLPIPKVLNSCLDESYRSLGVHRRQ